MKKLFKIIIAFILITWLPFKSYSQFSETDEFTRKFQVSEDTRIELSNKYGQIEIITWDKDSVVIDVSVRVEEKKLEKLEKTMDGIDFEFTNSQHFLIVRTLVNQSRGWLEREIANLTNSILGSESNVEINYKVWLPKNCDLKIENKYGDIFLDDLESEVELNLSNGNLRANELNGNIDITLEFADATINKMNNGRINCNYSDLYIKEAEILSIESKQSDFEILEITELNGNTRRDKIQIRTIDIIDIDGNLTNLRITEIYEQLNLQLDYGDLYIEKANPEFSNFLIESKSTDIDIYFEPESQFRFVLTHIKSDIFLSDNIEIEEEEVLDEKDNRIQIKGKFGSNMDSPEQLFINANSGEINLFSN